MGKKDEMIRRSNFLAKNVRYDNIWEGRKENLKN
jgi:hypothetical protein